MNTGKFYSDINKGNINKYQEYFLEMLNTADVDNLTNWSQSLDFDKDEYDKSYKGLEPILDRAEKNGFVPTNLQIMFEQYIFADVYEREKHKNSWVKRVLSRKGKDFFPDPNVVLKTLQK